MESIKYFYIYFDNIVQSTDETHYKEWFKSNWYNYTTGLCRVSNTNDLVSTSFVGNSALNEQQPRLFVMIYYKNGNLHHKKPIKEYFATWEEALTRHQQLIEYGFGLLRKTA